MSETMKLSPIIEKRLEPFREPEYATIRVPVDCIPHGAKLVEAYETETQIIICGEPPDEPEGLTPEQYDAWCETSHNCDAMGCGTLSHITYRFNKAELEQARECERMVEDAEAVISRILFRANYAIDQMNLDSRTLDSIRDEAQSYLDKRKAATDARTEGVE